MDLNHDTIEEDWLRSPNFAPARVQELASEMLRADEARMTALHARMLRVKRIHNSAALINARLPLEILVEVFRLAGPLTGSKDAIRLTHVCHAWRTLIHDTPAFWTDFVFPPPGHLLVGSTRRNHSSVVLDALARTAPMRITFGLCGDYLPVLNTPAAESHLSRISALYLDCTGGGDGDMRPFFDLSLLSLESLELRVKCDASLLPADIAAESPARFPRLRILRTTCTGFPLAWVGPSLKILDVLAGLEEAVTPRQARRVRCCYPGSLSELFLVLERCPGLEVLGFFGCLPHDPVPIAQSTSPRLDHLETVRIWDDADCIRMFLERITLPRDAFVTICTDSAYDALSEFLPAANRLQAIPLIEQIELSVCRPAEVRFYYPHIVQGYVQEACGESRTRLAVLSSDQFFLQPATDVDLLRLFRGFAPIFSPAAIFDLDVTLCRPVRDGQSEAWAWVLGYFPKITHLSVEAASSRDVFLALSQENVASGLSHLYVIQNGAQDWVAEYEEMVSVLELRAARALRPEFLLYRQQVKGEEDEIPPPVPVSYVERLQAVVGRVMVPLPCCVD